MELNTGKSVRLFVHLSIPNMGPSDSDLDNRGQDMLRSGSGPESLSERPESGYLSPGSESLRPISFQMLGFGTQRPGFKAQMPGYDLTLRC